MLMIYNLINMIYMSTGIYNNKFNGTDINPFKNKSFHGKITCVELGGSAPGDKRLYKCCYLNLIYLKPKG